MMCQVTLTVQEKHKSFWDVLLWAISKPQTSTNFDDMCSEISANWGLEIWPEFTLSHGRNSIGNIIFTGNAYNLIDNELDLNAGSIEITKLVLRPEARVPADLLGIADKMTLFTFAPKLMCEEIVANSPIQYTQERNCGRGAEYGLARRSEDGLTEFTGKIVIDTVGVNTRTSINVNLGYQF